MTKPTNKDLWKATLLEFLHNYFIGISHLECSNLNCPLVLNWNDLETKLSKKGKGALYKISQEKWIVADLIKYETNDLGTYENIEIQLKSGKVYRTKSKNYTEPSDPAKKEIFLKPEEIILFFNNSSHTANLLNAETIYLDELWTIKERIKWDQKASKKKIINWVEQKPDGEDKAYKIDEWESNYIFNIHNPDITNEIKDHEVYSAPNTKEREQLWKDYHQELSELKEVYGIRHNTDQKEERQNNPEISLLQSPFLALERDKWRERMKAIKDFENKRGCSGIHTLTYGTNQETKEQVELQEENQKKDKETDEEKAKEIKEKTTEYLTNHG